MNLPLILPDMPEAEYRAHPAFANSDLKVARGQSPAHMIHKRTHGSPDTPAKRDGRILHTAILEPHQFSARYVVLPADAEDRPTDAMRQAVLKGTASENSIKRVSWWDAWNATNEGRELIAADKYDEFMRVTEAIREHPALRGYFNSPGVVTEQSVFATDPETGLPVKIRRDLRVRLGGYNVVLDLKSAESAATNDFHFAIKRYGYVQGAAFYTDVGEWAGDPTDVYLLIAFEREAPYGVTVHEVGPEAMAKGRMQYREALTLVKHCVDTGEYPLYPTDVQVVGEWAAGY